MFDDRREAGRRLATALRRLRLRDPIIMALPRGGVPVAAEIASALGAPLDIVVVRKLGVPYHPELAMGAIGPGVEVIDEAVMERAGVDGRALEQVVEREREELLRREEEYRAAGPHPRVDGRDVVVVDDGIATGSTAMAAIQVLCAQGAGRIVLAVPVLPASAVPMLQRLVDDLVYVEAPRQFVAVGQFYVDFDQTTDDEVREALRQAQQALSMEARR